MNQRVPVRFGKTVCALALAASAVAIMTSTPFAQAQDQPPQPAPEPAAPATPAPPAPPADLYSAPAPAIAGALPDAAPMAGPLVASEPSDHDAVIGLWGIQARRLGSFRRSVGQDVGCAEPCTSAVNTLGVRRWLSQHYGYSMGLAIGTGGGSRRNGNATQTFDTYLGVGPSVGAHFLVANWKHLAVNISPELDAVFFLPSSSGKKSILINVRSVIEGEIHLGMIGLPAASVGIATGLTGSFLKVTKGSAAAAAADPDTTSTRWNIGVTGPESLWDLVTTANLRYYF